MNGIMFHLIIVKGEYAKDVFIKLTEQREEREIQLAAGAKRESEEKKS